VLLPDQFEHPAADWGKALPAQPTKLLGAGQSLGDAALMIVILTNKMRPGGVSHSILLMLSQKLLRWGTIRFDFRIFVIL
jgi:hypothetical protein